MSETLNLTWFIPPVIQQMAEFHGFLETFDIEVQGILTRSSDQQFEALRDGTRDVAVTAMDNVIHWNRRDGGGDFRIIAQVESDTGNTLVAQPNIASIADLAGKRLLVDSAENGFVVVLRALLADAGINFDDCTIVRSGGVKERLDAMAAGDGDATLLGPPFIEFAVGMGMHPLAVASAAYPDFPGQGIVVRQAVIAERAETLERWLAALEQGRAKALQDPIATASHLEDSGLPTAAAARLAGYVGDSLVPRRASIELLINQRRRLGLLGGDTRVDDLFDPIPLQHALSRFQAARKDPLR